MPLPPSVKRRNDEDNEGPEPKARKIATIAKDEGEYEEQDRNKIICNITMKKLFCFRKRVKCGDNRIYRIVKSLHKYVLQYYKLLQNPGQVVQSVQQISKKVVQEKKQGSIVGSVAGVAVTFWIDSGAEVNTVKAPVWKYY